MADLTQEILRLKKRNQALIDKRNRLQGELEGVEKRLKAEGLTMEQAEARLEELNQEIAQKEDSLHQRVQALQEKIDA